MALNTHSLDLESSSSQYASISQASAPNLAILGSQTWEAWVRPESIGSFQYVMGRVNSGASLFSTLVISNTGNPYFELNGLSANTGASGITLVAGQTYHVAGVYDATAGKIRLYVNGLLVRDVTVTGTVADTVSSFSIGRGGDYNGNYADGLVDDVRVWNVARTSQQIKDNIFQDVAGQTGLQGYWKLDNSYADSSGNGYTLSPGNSPTFSADVPFPEYTEVNSIPLGDSTLFGDANCQFYLPLNGNSNDAKGSNNGSDSNITYSTGRFSQGAIFNGSSSVITTGSPVMSGTGQYSIGVWIKTSSNSSDNTIFTQRNDNSSGIWTLRMTAGKINFWDYNGSAFQFSTSSTSAIAINDDEWHLVIFTRNGTAGRYYVDGILQGTTTALSNLSWNSQVMKIGKDSVGNTYFTGTKDEVFSFNRELTGTEIFELYTGLNVASSSSVSPSLSPSSSVSPSISPSSSISNSISPSSSISPSVSPSSSTSPSSSASPSISPSSSISNSISPSSSVSPSVSASPSVGYSDYSRGNYVVLPTNTSDLETPYSEQDELDVAEEDGILVEQSGMLEYMIHQFKDVIEGGENNCTFTWIGQSNLAPSNSTVYLQVYNRDSGSWETIDSNDTENANINFTLSAHMSDLTDYKDASNIVVARVYQEAI